MTDYEIEQLKVEFKKREASLKIPFYKILEQINTFEKGIPYLKLVRPCTIGDGIQLIDEEEEYDELISFFDEAVENGRVCKFVPASGAASRMFKSLQTIKGSFKKINREELKKGELNGDEDCKSTLEFVDNIKKFAFYADLRKVLANDGYDFDKLIEEEEYDEIIHYTLDSAGLNYVNQPKGSIKFHLYPEGAKTAFEEHLVEAINYTGSESSTAKIHFTISPEYRGLINAIINPVIVKYRQSGIQIDVSYSYQKPSTDTIAVTSSNRPFLDDRNELVFRPAGHGALLENLNDLRGDIIFIKNIDNIVTEHLRGTTYLYKKLLAGYLIKLQEKIATYMRALDTDDISSSTINSIKRFAMNELSIQFNDEFDKLNTAVQKNILYTAFHRPIRVCGMVKNEGEPGGGPFWVKDRQGNIALQIVEESQIDVNDADQRKILEASEFFNPVDIVCGVRDSKGHLYNLLNYTDPQTGLITKKSKNGQELKALELPGLWNGSMAKWITIFVKVPAITFNPVKVINDLLRKEHQPPETDNYK